MSTAEADTTVDVDADRLFEYLSQVSNLPEYFPAMKSAESVGGGDEVHTTAVDDDGNHHEGTAWFRVDKSNRSIEWGSESDANYHGELSVSAAGDTTSVVSISLSTERSDAGDLEDSLNEVLERIKSLVED